MKNNSKKKEEAPMGVSQWREHGKKYGYWDFFKDETKCEECKKEGLQRG